MLNFNMDIKEESIWINSTPSNFAKSLPFYCSEMGEFYAQKNFFTERDFKDAYWLAYTVDGEGELYYNDSNITLIAGSCCLINCRQAQSYRTAQKSKDWHHFWVHLDGNGLENYLSTLNNMQNIVAFNVDSQTEELFKNLQLYAKQSSTEDMLEISVILHRIVHNFYKANHCITHSDDKRREIIYGAAKTLRANFADKFSLEDLAAKTHLSKYHFSRLFKLYMGTSPYDYLLHYRITKAKQLLCTTDMSVGQIALAIGFNSESNFSSQFTRLTSMGPLKYRKEHYNVVY